MDNNTQNYKKNINLTPNTLIKVLFVCHGNICRSPMAESIFTHIVKKNHLEKYFLIDSAGTSDEERGLKPHFKTQNKLKQMNIELVDHKARQIKRDDYNKFDFIICMDDINLNNIKRIIPNDSNKKIFKLLNFIGSNSNIKDPYYSGDFNQTYDDIYIGCEGLLKYLI